MKIWEINFKAQQPVHATQYVAAEDEAAAREGLRILLENRVPGFEIVSCRDASKLDPEVSAQPDRPN